MLRVSGILYATVLRHMCNVTASREPFLPCHKLKNVCEVLHNIGKSCLFASFECAELNNTNFLCVSLGLQAQLRFGSKQQKEPFGFRIS